jgi:aryl-alcohol dehydrogenase-like predicted oxidoreductase
VPGTAAHPYQRRQILRQFETTRDNLGTGYLDLYFLHSTDFGPEDRYLDEAVEIMRGLRNEGLIRAVGMRAPHEFAQEWAATPGHPHTAETARFLELFDRIRPDVLTVRHNLLSPLYTPAETDALTFARQRKIGVLMKQILGQGILINAYDPTSPPVFPPDDHRHADRRFTGPALQAVHDGLSALRRRFGDSRADLTRLALQYALQSDPDAVALIGFRNAEQVTGNLAALGKSLTLEDIGEIRRCMSPVRDMLARHPHHTDSRQNS